MHRGRNVGGRLVAHKAPHDRLSDIRAGNRRGERNIKPIDQIEPEQAQTDAKRGAQQAENDVLKHNLAHDQTITPADRLQSADFPDALVYGGYGQQADDCQTSDDYYYGGQADEAIRQIGGADQTARDLLGGVRRVGHLGVREKLGCALAGRGHFTGVGCL